MTELVGSALAWRVERAALSAWPAIETEEREGWLLRTSGGYTKRSNSANPQQLPKGDLTPIVVDCEAAYRQRGLPPVFRLTSILDGVERLDAMLVDRGYLALDPTRVLWRPFHAMQDLPRDRAPAGRIDMLPQDAWHSAHARITGAAPHPMERAILQRLPGEPLFACLWTDGDYRACAIGVQEDGLATTFSVATEPDYRRRGLARALLGHLLAIARERGAEGAHLNVVERNRAARQLYRSLGFHELYRYWYRVPADWPHT